MIGRRRLTPAEIAACYAYAAQREAQVRTERNSHRFFAALISLIITAALFYFY